MLLRKQLARLTPQRPEQRSEVPEHEGTSTILRTREQGTPKDRWQQEEVLGSSIYSTAPVPGGGASGQLRQKVRHAYPCSLHPSGSSERPPIWKSDGSKDSSS